MPSNVSIPQPTFMNPSLSPLMDYLDGLTCQADIDGLHTVLASLDIGAEDLADHARFSEKRYVRNLVRGAPLYHLLVLCWRSGQRSPIHNHAGSTCGVRVLRGVATETRFDRTPSGLLKPTGSFDLMAGQSIAGADDMTHQVSNLQAAGEDLITLHVYSPPLLRMETFSLTDGAVGEHLVDTREHIHGCGI